MCTSSSPPSQSEYFSRLQFLPLLLTVFLDNLTAVHSEVFSFLLVFIILYCRKINLSRTRSPLSWPVVFNHSRLDFSELPTHCTTAVTQQRPSTWVEIFLFISLENISHFKVCDHKIQLYQQLPCVLKLQRNIPPYTSSRFSRSKLQICQRRMASLTCKRLRQWLNLLFYLFLILKVKLNYQRAMSVRS